MEVTLVLLLLQIASGFCLNLQSLESYLEHDAELQINDKADQGSVKELNENPERVNPGRRIFKVLPVKANKKWTPKLQAQSDKSHLTEDVPIAIIVAAKNGRDEPKLNTEYVYPREKSGEEAIDVKPEKTHRLIDNISPPSALNTSKSGRESNNDAVNKHALDHVNDKNDEDETIPTKKSMQNNNKDLKEKRLEVEKSTSNNKIDKDLKDIDVKKIKIIPKLDMSDRKSIEGNNDDEHYYDDKLTQMIDDENIESDERKTTVLQTSDDVIHEIETKFSNPTLVNKNELNEVLKDYIDESKIIVGRKPHKDFMYKDFNLFFIFNK